MFAGQCSTRRQYRSNNFELREEHLHELEGCDGLTLPNCLGIASHSLDTAYDSTSHNTASLQLGTKLDQ